MGSELSLHFHVTLSTKGWIGFSRTPHSDAVFSGKITFDDRTFEGSPLGFGLQGHNCGYRHRKFWTWTHAYFDRGSEAPTTLEALQYEMPLGLAFRKAVLWHRGVQRTFSHLTGEVQKSPEGLQWQFVCGGPGTFAIRRRSRVSAGVFRGSSSCSRSCGANRPGDNRATTNVIASRTGGRHFMYDSGTSLLTGTISPTDHLAIASGSERPVARRSPVSIAATRPS